MPTPLDFSKLPSKKPVAPAPAPAKAAPGRLDFGAVKLPVKPAPVPPPVANTPVRPQAAFADKFDSQAPQVLEIIKQQNAQLYSTEYSRLELRVKQLLPLTAEVVISWGDKAMAFIAGQTSEASKFVRDVTEAKVNELIEESLEATRAKPGLMSMLRGDKVINNKPALRVAQSNITTWIPQVQSLLESSKVTAHKMIIELAAFHAVLTYLGDIPDTMLNKLADDRLRVLQQAATQAQLTVQQLEHQQQEMYSLKTRIDQFINVTLVAYESAKAR